MALLTQEAKATTIIISQNLKYTPGRINDGTLIGAKAIVRAAKVIVKEISLVFMEKTKRSIRLGNINN
jgi:hypothetical protein